MLTTPTLGLTTGLSGDPLNEPAKEPVTVPKFEPTRPPAEALSHKAFPLHAGRFTLDVTFPLAWEALICEPGEFDPTSPPSATFTPALLILPVAEDPSILPAAVTLGPLVAPFWPTSP